MPSSVVRKMDYDCAHQRLRVEYVSGNIYDYFNVPAEVYEAMVRAGSKGVFLNQHIKGHYSFERVKQ